MDNELKLKLKRAIFDGFTNYRRAGDMRNLYGIVDYISNSIIDTLVGYVSSEEGVKVILKDEELLGFICNKLCTLLDFENCCTWNKTAIKKRFNFNFNIYTGDTLNTCMFCSSTYNLSDENSTDNLCPKCAVEYIKIAEIEAITNEFLTYCKDEHTARCDASFYNSYSPKHTLERTKILMNRMLKFIHNISLVGPVLPHDENVNMSLQCLENLLRNHIDCNNNINFSIPSGTLNKGRNYDMGSLQSLSYKHFDDFFNPNMPSSQQCNNSDSDYYVYDKDIFLAMSDNGIDGLIKPSSNELGTVLFVDSNELIFNSIVDKIKSLYSKCSKLYVVDDNSKFDIHTDKVIGYDGLIIKFDDNNELNTVNRNLNLVKYFNAHNPNTTLYIIVDNKFKDDVKIDNLRQIIIK